MTLLVALGGKIVITKVGKIHPLEIINDFLENAHKCRSAVGLVHSFIFYFQPLWELLY